MMLWCSFRNAIPIPLSWQLQEALEEVPTMQCLSSHIPFCCAGVLVCCFSLWPLVHVIPSTRCKHPFSSLDTYPWRLFWIPCAFWAAAISSDSDHCSYSYLTAFPTMKAPLSISFSISSPILSSTPSAEILYLLCWIRNEIKWMWLRLDNFKTL